MKQIDQEHGSRKLVSDGVGQQVYVQGEDLNEDTQLLRKRVSSKDDGRNKEVKQA